MACGSTVCALCARTTSLEYICPLCLFGTDQGAGVAASNLGEKRLPMAKKETLCHLCGATIAERAHCAVLEHCKKHKLCQVCCSNPRVIPLTDIPCPGAILAAAEPVTSMERAIGRKITPELINLLLDGPATLETHGSYALDAQAVSCKMFLPYDQLKELTAVCNELDQAKARKPSAEIRGVSTQDPKSWSDTVVLANTPQNADLTWRISALQTQCEKTYYHPRMANLATPDDACVLPSNFDSDEHRQSMKSVKMGAYVKCIKLGAPPNTLSALLQSGGQTPEELADLAGIPLPNSVQLSPTPCLVALRQK